MKRVSVGLIGAGYMGKAHAIAFSSAPTVFSLSGDVVCEMLFDPERNTAKEKAQDWGFKRYTDDWKKLVNDSNIDVVDICSPNFLHKEMALAAISAGKHVYCEKPLALNPEDALEMTLAAEKAGVKTLVGFNYVKNPAVQLAKEIIKAGKIGDVVHFRGTFNEDYLADKDIPFSWRLKRKFSGSGALGDLGTHLINAAQYLVSPITEVCADIQTVHKKRPRADESNDDGIVENDDQTHMMARFENGAIGTLESSRIAWGRKNSFTFEVGGTRGTILYDQEALSELKLFTSDSNNYDEGFRRILLGPQHPDYEHFCVAAGHGLGYNDMKTIEVRDLVEGIVADKPMYPDFRAAYEVNCIVSAAEESFSKSRWVVVSKSG